MEEKRFQELLLKNNKYLIQEIDERMDQKIKENNEHLIQEMDRRMDQKMKENNEYLIQEMDERMDQKIKEKNEHLIQEMDRRMDKKLFESERRQNQKLAVMEHTYGEKINATFDKILSIEEILLDTRAQSINNQNFLQKHDDVLFSHDFRISKLEKQINS